MFERVIYLKSKSRLPKFTIHRIFTNRLIPPKMYRMNYDYMKGILEKVSFDPELFAKELKTTNGVLLPYEIEKLNNCLILFTKDKPELREILVLNNE